MNSAFEFWREVLRAYVEGTAPPLVPSGNEEELVHVGERTHTLEFLDHLLEDPARGPGSVSWVSRERRASNVFENRTFREELARIDEKARDRDLPYAWLKGGEFLRRSVYPKGLRRLSDLDLLLRKEDLEAWDEVFGSLGYRTHRDPEWILGDGFDESVSSTFYTKKTKRKDLLVDVHWHLVDYPARRACGRWDFDMEPVFEGIENHALRREHRILYLIDHAFTHEFQYGKFVTDLYHVLAGTDVDWEEVRGEARRTNLVDSLTLGVGFLREVFEEDPPDVFRGLLEAVPVAEEVSPASFVRGALEDELPEGAYLKQSLRWLDSLYGKCSFLGYVLVPPVSAVPMVSSESDLLEVVSLYGRRLGRVFGKGPGILGS